MKALLARLTPRSLVGQIILLVALALFVAQGINYALLVRERGRQALVAITAPSVGRIVDALDHRPPGEPNHVVERGRVRLTDHAPAMVGTRRHDVEKRAADMLSEFGVATRSVIVLEDRARPPRSRWAQLQLQKDGRGSHPVKRMTLAVEYAPGRWAVTQTWNPAMQPRFAGWLVGQTLILYVIVLLPLLWVGRRLARPLRDLTASARQFAVSGSAGRVEEGGPGDVRDLTTAFNAMYARLFAMLDEKDRMLGAIGHDLRTPLASLRVRTESVEDEGERARMSETIEEMSRMLDDILQLARAGRSSEPVSRVDLSALADAVVEDFIELGSPVDLAEGGRVIGSVRPQLIRRALRNLIENAVVYGTRAHVAVVEEEHAIRLVVTDEGPGIAEDRMEEMTQAFTRIEGSRNRETGGAGLGLALVRAIMAEHKGTLRLANRPQGGLEASLVLPK
ncbi:sensor histidine kinase [Sphingobium aquiterrae]|uniref:sensor histidine kinase n=1 Tax=Sphingobium aquiterrae TaxID=2038656 RepID=UPI00301821FB